MSSKDLPISEVNNNNRNSTCVLQSDPVVNNALTFSEASNSNNNSTCVFQSDALPVSKANSVSNSNEVESISNSTPQFQEQHVVSPIVTHDELIDENFDSRCKFSANRRTQQTTSFVSI